MDIISNNKLDYNFILSMIMNKIRANWRNNEDYALFYYRDTPYKWNDGNFGKDEAGTVTFIVEWDN